MALDPQVRQMIDRLASIDLPPLTRQTPAEARESMLLRSRLLARAVTVGPVSDHEVGVDGGKIGVRIYRPRTDVAPRTLVYFHGGGWVIGSIETHDSFCRELVQASGWAVASVDYRLAPEFRCPVAAEDCFAATLWVSARAASLGLSPDVLAVGGDSAGGNLAAVVALLARDRGAPDLHAQLLIYPITDYSFETDSYAENAEGYLLSRADMEWFWSHYLGESFAELDVRAAPLRAARLDGLPEALVITAEYDPLRDEGEAFARRLDEAGVRVRLSRYDGMVHGFVRMTGQLDRARDALDEMAAFLDGL